MYELTLPTAEGGQRKVFKREDRIYVSMSLFSILAVTILLPILLMLIWSLADGWAWPNLFPKHFTLDHWRFMLDDGGLGRALVSSLAISFAVTFATAVIAFPTAWAMARFPFRLKRAVEIFILAPIMIPGLVVAVGIGQLFIYMGIAYTIMGVILVQIVGTLPMMIRLMTASLEAIPDDLLHAARSLGAGRMGIFTQVILPLSTPGLLAGGLMSFVGSFEEFDRAFIVGAPVVQTLPVKLYTYLDPQSMQLPLAAVVSFILLIPALVVFVIAGRILRDDLLAAGMGKM